MVIDATKIFKKANMKSLSNVELTQAVKQLRNGLIYETDVAILYPSDIPFMVSIMKQRTYKVCRG